MEFFMKLKNAVITIILIGLAGSALLGAMEKEEVEKSSSNSFVEQKQCTICLESGDASLMVKLPCAICRTYLHHACYLQLVRQYSEQKCLFCKNHISIKLEPIRISTQDFLDEGESTRIHLKSTNVAISEYANLWKKTIIKMSSSTNYKDELFYRNITNYLMTQSEQQQFLINDYNAFEMTILAAWLRFMMIIENGQLGDVRTAWGDITTCKDSFKLWFIATNDMPFAPLKTFIRLYEDVNDFNWRIRIVEERRQQEQARASWQNWAREQLNWRNAVTVGTGLAVVGGVAYVAHSKISMQDVRNGWHTLWKKFTRK